MDAVNTSLHAIMKVPQLRAASSLIGVYGGTVGVNGQTSTDLSASSERHGSKFPLKNLQKVFLAPYNRQPVYQYTAATCTESCVLGRCKHSASAACNPSRPAATPGQRQLSYSAEQVFGFSILMVFIPNSPPQSLPFIGLLVRGYTSSESTTSLACVVEFQRTTPFVRPRGNAPRLFVVIRRVTSAHKT